MITEFRTTTIGTITVIATIINGTKSLMRDSLLEANLSNFISLLIKDVVNWNRKLKECVPRLTYSSTGRMITKEIITKRLPIKDAVANLNSDVHLTIAIDAVELTPDTISVAPVSPRDLAKAKTDPEKIPGRAKGNKTFLKVVRELAPSVLEASS